jgi:hypothetical protein
MGEAVVREHSARYPEKDRNKESLRREFMDFVNSKKPTGDQICWQHIMRDISARKDAGDAIRDDQHVDFALDDDDDGVEVVPVVRRSDLGSARRGTQPRDRPPEIIFTSSAGRGGSRPLVSHRCGGNAMEPMMQMRILTLLNRQQETEDADREERRAEREDQQQQNMMILLLMTTIM